jgi:glycosyltransferase involved in cell wall biosynthesis
MTIAYPLIKEHNIYTDLMQEFVRNGHKVFIACSNEKRNNMKTTYREEEGINVLRILTGNITGNVNLFEKGISTVTLENKFIKAIKAFYHNIKFDLILYSTPPITLVHTVEYFKKRDNANTYLLLKDIFPQNAVDIGMMNGSSLLYRYFRNKEKKLYNLSDYIGCMSKANVNYILRKNRFINKAKVEVCPNSIALSVLEKSDVNLIAEKYQIPNNCTVFIYGGNIGRPQGIDFIIECLKKNINQSDRFFIICGKGAEYYKLESFFSEYTPTNVLIINGLPKKEYDNLAKRCDVGLIFLDHRFTIPNFPSRLLSYMEFKMPVFACTDINTDIGEVICEGKFGWWCESNDSNVFKEVIDSICSSKDTLTLYGENARIYLEENFSVKTSYYIIMRHFYYLEDQYNV